MHRFHIAADTVVADDVSLPPHEAHHALHVLRIEEGAAVVLFDGQGREVVGRVSRITRTGVTVSVEQQRHVPKPLRSVALAQAWLQADKAIDYVVRHGTELGADCFVFFPAARSQRKPHLNPKWERVAIETCKQCGRLWLPGFEVARDIAEVAATAQGDLLIASHDSVPIPLNRALSTGNTLLLVGPEGDFTNDELATALRAGAKPLSLGPTVFRAEVASIVALTLVQYEVGGLGPR